MTLKQKKPFDYWKTIYFHRAPFHPGVQTSTGEFKVDKHLIRGGRGEGGRGGCATETCSMDHLARHRLNNTFENLLLYQHENPRLMILSILVTYLLDNGGIINRFINAVSTLSCNLLSRYATKSDKEKKKKKPNWKFIKLR